MKQTEINQTFFDSLLLADSERIHSQMLAWILNLPEQIFPLIEKTTLLESLFLFENPLIIKTINVTTEINHIDILIELDQHILVLENKLKSSEHNSQTYKYVDSVSKLYNQSNKSIKFAFISLIGEKPINKDWNVISFENLLHALNKIEWNNSCKESLFIIEYIQTLNNLVYSFNTFLANHKSFDSIFIDGFKSKHKKTAHLDKIKDYIRINQLETIFQKAFLKEVALIGKLEKFVITETRGTALIQLFVASIQFENKEYHLGLQFQGRCLKVNLILQTNSKAKTSIPNALKDFFGNSFSKKNGYNRYNRNNTNPYISVTKNISNPLYELSKIEIAAIVNNEIDFIKSNLNSFKNLLIIKDE